MSQYQQQPNSSYPPQAGPGQGPPPGWGQQPPPYAPQPPKKRTGLKIVLGAVAAIFAIAVVANLAGGGDPTTPTTEDPAAGPTDGQQNDGQQREPKEAAGIDDPVRDGKFEFTVTKVETDIAKIGPKFLVEKAQGQFVLVHVTVENIGDEAQYLSATDQYLYDQAGRKHSADDSAWVVIENNPLLEQINPGNSVDGTIVFDIPKNAVPKSFELHDSPLSGGVSVATK